MNLTDDEILKFQRGSPVLLEDVCAIYPATLGEIIDIGYSNFQRYLGLLTAMKPEPKKGDNPELKKVLEELTDFQYLLMMTAIDAEVNSLTRDAFKFFIRDEVLFCLDPAQIVIGPANENHIMTEDIFYDFQKILRRMYFLEQEGEEIIINADDPPAVKRLKMQMRRNRERVRKAKAKQAEKEKSDLKFSDLVGSITINNCGLNMDNIWNITYYALQDQLKRMGWRDQFDINNRAALAGAKLKKNQLKHWMRSIASSEKS